MVASTMHHGHEEDEEEFVLLDLDVLSGRFEIPPNAPCVLSGLYPLLSIIYNKTKPIGEYEETIGTCFVFSEDGEPHYLNKAAKLLLRMNKSIV